VKQSENDYMKPFNKKPLYIKVNTRARGVHHLHGGDYKESRSANVKIATTSTTATAAPEATTAATTSKMKQGIQRGLDYTPLFKFLLSKLGGNWNEIHSEAVSRIDKEAPIFWIVAKDYDSAVEVVRVGDNAFFSGLFIDDKGILCAVNPKLNEHSLEPNCHCCTHTFNGIVFTQKYDSKFGPE
jgi:hypothetical protein